MGIVRILLSGDTHLGFDFPFRPRIQRRRRGPDFFANYEKEGFVMTLAGFPFVRVGIRNDFLGILDQTGCADLLFRPHRAYIVC